MADGTTVAEHPFARAPVLSLVCAVAGNVALVVGRLLVPALYEHAADRIVAQLGRLSDLALNVVAVTCVISLSAVLVATLRRPRVASILGRIAIAMFSGLFMPTIVLTAVLPRAATTVQLVAYGGWSASALSLLLALAAARRSNSVAMRLLVAAPALAAVASFVALAAERLPALAHLDVAEPIARVATITGELAWIAIAPVAATALRLRWDDRRARIALAVGAVAFFLADGVFAWAAGALRQSYGDVLYYAIRASLFVERWPSLYGGVAGLYAMVAAVALCAREPARRQIGIGLLLLFAGGITPRMPATIALAVLGVAVMMRVVIAFSPEPIEVPRDAVADEVGVS